MLTSWLLPFLCMTTVRQIGNEQERHHHGYYLPAAEPVVHEEEDHHSALQKEHQHEVHLQHAPQDRQGL